MSSYQARHAAPRRPASTLDKVTRVGLTVWVGLAVLALAALIVGAP